MQGKLSTGVTVEKKFVI